MELSEHESRILQEIQLDLTTSAPRLARVLTTNTSRAWAIRHLILGTAIMGIGIGLMVFALDLRSMAVGAAAFTAMTAGAYVASPRTLRSTLGRGRRRTGPDSQLFPEE